MKFYRHILLYVLSACILACQAASDPVHSTSGEDVVLSEDLTSAEGDVSFSDVLDEYRTLNTRLENVAAPLLLANAGLCPRTRREPGFTVHTVQDYPEELRVVAKALLPVSDRLSLRTVREGGPADLAGLRPGDEVVKISTFYLPSGQTAKAMYRALARTAFDVETVTVSVRRGGTRIDVALSPETICDYPVNVFFSENINGHTDGDEVWITSQLLRTVPDDSNLALIVAHEMSHAIDGHMNRTPSKALELAADRMGLILMDRAGFDIDRAIAYWQNTRHPHQQYQNFSDTHPSIAERLAGFEATRADIAAARAAGRVPEF